MHQANWVMEAGEIGASPMPGLNSASCAERSRPNAKAFPMMSWREKAMETILRRSWRVPWIQVLLIAVHCTTMLARHLSISDAVALLELVGKSSASRSLLLVGVVAMRDRDSVTARRLLDILDAGHPARQLPDLGDSKLPQTARDDLGCVRLRRSVGVYLKDFFSQ